MPYAYRLRTVSFVSESRTDLGTAANNPPATAAILRSIFATLDADREHFVLLVLNTKNRVTGFKVCATGGMDLATVDRRTILRDALTLGAARFIVAHNHPSGDPEPSPEDLSCAKALAEGGRAIGCQLVDALVLGHDRYVSFHERGLLR